MNRRHTFRKDLSSLYLPYYDALCSELSGEWQPYCGNRTFMEQTKLYMQGRITPGPVVTYAKSGQSAHNYGCASDWCLWEKDKPYWPDPKDPKWREYANACEKVGLRWGGEFSHPDCPHNELFIGCSWNHVLVEYNKGGMRVAQEFIEERLKARPSL